MIGDFYYEQLLSAFQLDKNTYHNISRHKTDTIGFSTYRTPTEQLLKTLQTDIHLDYRTLIAVYFDKTLPKIENKQPISIRMSFCLYNNNEYYLDYTNVKKKNALPIDIYYHDEIICDLQSAILYDKNGNNIDGKKLIDDLYVQHIKMAKKTSRFWYTIRNVGQKTIPINFLSFAFSSMNCILKWFTGDSIKRKQIQIHFLDNNDETIDNVGAETIWLDFLGLKVKAIPMFTYSLCHLIGYFIFSSMHLYPLIIKRILNYNLLTIVYGIVTFFVYTKIPELTLKPLLILVDTKRIELIRKRIEP